MGSEEISIVGYNLTTANYIKSLKEVNNFLIIHFRNRLKINHLKPDKNIF